MTPSTNRVSCSNHLEFTQSNDDRSNTAMVDGVSSAGSAKLNGTEQNGKVQCQTRIQSLLNGTCVLHDTPKRLAFQYLVSGNAYPDADTRAIYEGLIPEERFLAALRSSIHYQLPLSVFGIC